MIEIITWTLIGTATLCNVLLTLLGRKATVQKLQSKIAKIQNKIKNIKLKDGTPNGNY